MSGPEQNVALVRRYYEEVLSGQQLDRLEEFLAPGFVDTNAGADAAAGGQRPPGIDQIRGWWGMVFRAFPDTRIEHQVIFGEGDKVVEHSTVHGTNTGPWMAFPATGKEVVWEMTNMYRIEGDKIVERWGAYDMPGIMQQLGVIQGGPMAAGPPGQ